MNQNRLFAEAMNQARKQEEKTGKAVPKVYILDGSIYLDERELGGKEPDYTLVRSDLDENFKSDINTKIKEDEKRGF